MTTTKRFKVTYEIVTPDSAEYGDAAYRGFLPRSGTLPRRNNMPKRPSLFSLREAFDMMNGTIEADSSPCQTPRWITCYLRDEPSGSEVISLHLDGATNASKRRIGRLFGLKIG